MAFWHNIFHKVKAKPDLIWTAQYLSQNPKEDGTNVINYAKTKVGTFEIYESDNDEFGTDYLLTYPRLIGEPAELFFDLGLAKKRASKAFNKQLNKRKHDDTC